LFCLAGLRDLADDLVFLVMGDLERADNFSAAGFDGVSFWQCFNLISDRVYTGIG